MEITIAEFRKWEPGSYRLIDIRGDQDVAYGMVPGSNPHAGRGTAGGCQGDIRNLPDRSWWSTVREDDSA